MRVWQRHFPKTASAAKQLSRTFHHCSSLNPDTSIKKEEISSALTVKGTDVVKEKEEVTVLQRS